MIEGYEPMSVQNDCGARRAALDDGMPAHQHTMVRFDTPSSPARLLLARAKGEPGHHMYRRARQAMTARARFPPFTTRPGNARDVSMRQEARDVTSPFHGRHYYSRETRRSHVAAEISPICSLLFMSRRAVRRRWCAQHDDFFLPTRHEAS